MKNRIFRQPVFAVILTVLINLVFLCQPLLAASGGTTVYTAPDGFKVVSHSKAWADTEKLMSVYKELMNNIHGEEMKYLGSINIYPGPDPEGTGSAGRWYGAWKFVQGVPVLLDGRYIDIFNGDSLTTVESIARTIAHEYGHHFTYYHYFKKEKKTWDQWKSSGLAEARGLKNNQKVGTSGVHHDWMIHEIAAEDYVQLFGSPTVKMSQDFRDIADRLADGGAGNNKWSYNTDTFNYHPQENYRLPLAANVKGLKKYWLNAAGLEDTAGSPPAQVVPQLVKVNKYSGIDTPQYVFTWNASQDDRSAVLEYTLVWFEDSPGAIMSFYPVRTVIDGEPLTAVIGSAKEERIYLWERVPTGVAYFIVYVKDSDGLIISSPVLAVDFSDRLNPTTVLIDDISLLSGQWFSPRVKINDKQMSFDVPPVIKNGRTLVPLRAIFEELGAEVQWDEKTRTVTALKGDKVISLKIDSYDAEVDGSRVVLDVPAQIMNGRTLVPLRFVSEALGAIVTWNQRLQLVSIKPS